MFNKSNEPTKLHIDEDVSNKIEEYRTTVELSGRVISTLQNITSTMIGTHTKELQEISPDPISLLATIHFLQTELKKMIDATGMEVPDEAKRSFDIKEILGGK